MTDIQSIIEKMSLEEKAALCTGKDNWTTLDVEHLGVPEMPLLSILQFQEESLPMPAEDLVDMLLGQVYEASE